MKIKGLRKLLKQDQGDKLSFVIVCLVTSELVKIETEHPSVMGAAQYGEMKKHIVFKNVKEQLEGRFLDSDDEVEKRKDEKIKKAISKYDDFIYEVIQDAFDVVNSHAQWFNPHHKEREEEAKRLAEEEAKESEKSALESQDSNLPDLEPNSEDNMGLHNEDAKHPQKSPVINAIAKLADMIEADNVI